MDVKDVISNVKIYGLENAVKVSKYPKSVDVSKCSEEITDTVKKLGTAAGGTGHCNFLLGIIVQFDLTFSIKAWTEAERYHFMDIISSQSTMHKITKMDIEKSCVSYVSQRAIDNVKDFINLYNENPTPERYLSVLYNVPVGLKLTAGMTTNYLQLKTIYAQRKNHRLPEWQLFCKWLETLPNSEWITGNKNKLVIKPNPNKEEYDAATKGVEERNGYCPCALFETPETKCICANFKNQNHPGPCHCKRFIKVEE